VRGGGQRQQQPAGHAQRQRHGAQQQRHAQPLQQVGKGLQQDPGVEEAVDQRFHANLVSTQRPSQIKGMNRIR
jgi:hypothetical protein